MANVKALVVKNGQLEKIADADSLLVGSLTPGSVLFAGSAGEIDKDNANLFWDNTNKRLGVGTLTPNAPVDINANTPGVVGGFASGALHITSPSALENANAVITGHNLFGGNKQLWYLGSVSSSNDNIAFINRQNAALSLHTNNVERFKIDSAGAITATGSITAGKLVADNLELDGNLFSSSTGDIDVTTGTGGVFKFTDNAFQSGLDAVEFVEIGHGGGNGFINAVGDGGLDFRFEGATLATFTDFGHLHLLTNVDQKHTLKIKTANNLSDTGIAWENSGGSFTHTIFRTDVGTNRADLVFAAGLNADIDLLTDSFLIHGSTAEEGKLEVVGAFQVSSGTPGVAKVLTSDATGNATWQAAGWVDDGTVVRLATATDSVGIGTPSPTEILEVAAPSGNTTIRIDAEGGGVNEARLELASGATSTKFFYRDSDDSFGIFHKSITRIRIQSDGTILLNEGGGDVGVGTITPNQPLTVEGTMSLKEQAAANADTTAYGQIWVESTTPNVLKYTDDAGTDFTISGGAAATLFGINTATQSFVSTTTLADVTNLSVALEANKNYHVKAVIYLSTGGGGLKAALNGPAGFTSLHYIVQVTETDSFGAVGLHTAYDSATGQSTATLIAIEIHATIINGATAGNLVVRVAQNVSNAASSDILRDSFIRVEEIV